MGFNINLPPAIFVETEYQASQWIQYFLQSHKVHDGLGIDTETTGVVRHRDIPIIWSIADTQSRICLPAKFIPLFKEPLLENPKVAWDLTNARFDMHMLANVNVDLTKCREVRDTLVQSFLFDENRRGRHGLKESMKDHFEEDPPTFEDVFGKLPPAKKGVKKSYGDIINEALDDPNRRALAIDYAALDAYNTHRLRRYFDHQLDQIVMYDGMTSRRFFYEVSVPFTKVLWKMERRGFQIDAAYLSTLQFPMQVRLDEITKEFSKAAGILMNLNSTNAVRWFFFEFLKKDPIKHTKGGASGNVQPSVDAEVLDEWAGQGDAWAKMMLEYRGIAKIKGTYIDSIIGWWDDKKKLWEPGLIDGNYRIHTSLNQTGAQSGRLSSSDPNLQNIPRYDEDEFKIREAFIASEGKRLIVADYAQLEMRLMAHFSQDQKMIDAILNDIDLHCFTVAEMNGIPYDEVIGAVHAKEAAKKGGPKLTDRQKQLLFMRQAAKAVGFGIIYGIGGTRLAMQLTQQGSEIVTEAEGFKLIDKWFGVFPQVREFIEAMKAQIRTLGYVQTITGRFRRAGDIAGMSKKDAGQIERTLINAIIQGSAADITNASMLKAEHDPLLNSYGARMLLQIHDEIIWEVPDVEEIVEACKKRIEEIMQHPFAEDLRVPLPVEANDGYTWATAK